MNIKELSCKSVNNNLDEYLDFYNKVLVSMDNKELLGYFSKEDMEMVLNNGAKLFVYRNDKEIVCSFLYLPASKHSIKKFKLKYNPEEVGECGPILVNPKYRGNGLQKKMLQELTKYCKKLKKKYIVTTIHPDNIYSIKNFLSEGYNQGSSFNFKRGPRNLYIKYLDKKMIFLEGLPGVGKSTIVNELKKYNVNVVEELVNDPITEEDYLVNESLKINMYNEGKIVIDRGPISTLSYSQVKKIIYHEYDLSMCLKWFEKYKKYLENSEIIYLTNKGSDYLISSKDINSPYGSIDSQKMLENISLYNANKYCKNVKVIEYHKDNMEKIINEIIN